MLKHNMLKNTINLDKKIILTISILLLSVGGLSIADSFGQTNGIPELFIDLPQNALNDIVVEEESSSFDYLTIQKKDVNVDLAVFDGDKLNITAFGETFTITKYKTKSNDSQTIWWGNDKDGNETNLIIENGIVYGTIKTAEKTYYLDANEVNLIHTFTELDLSLIPNENDDEVEIEAGEAELSDNVNLPTETQNEIILFANSYIGGHDYQADGVTLTIDVAIGFTTAADDADSRVGQKIGTAVNNANRAYDNNNLPIELVVQSNREIRGYTEEADTGSGRSFVSGVTHDKHNLRNDNNHPNAGDLDGLRGNGLRDNTDVVILVVHTPGIGCGSAGDILADDIGNSIAVIDDSCLAGHTLTHEIGHLQGARHNPLQDNNNNPFAYQHGYLDGNVRQRTIMAYNEDSICDPLNRGFVCTRDNQFSDPYQEFFNTRTAAGIEATNFNAKVLYGTTQHIASLRGGEQTYDTQSPTGVFEWIGQQANRIFNQGDTMDISATFDEAIHVNHPPTVTVSDGTLITPIVMNRNSETSFSASHTLTNEKGTVTLQFSNAQDIFTNPVIPTATADSGSVTVNIPDTTPPVITLNPPNPQTIELGEGYTELDAITDDGSLVTINTSAFMDVVGTYSIFYNSVDAANNPAIQVVRTVNVVDTTKPLITLTGITPTLEVRVDSYTELGATVSDNDPNYSETVTIGGDIVNANLVGSYTVTYNALPDASGNNPNEVTRIVTVEDTIAPIITVDPLEITLELNSVAPTLLDGVSTDDSSPLTITGTVDILTIGDYEITYDSTDGTNDAISITRIYHVTDTIAPVITVDPLEITIELGSALPDFLDGVSTDDGSTVIALALGAIPTLGDFTIFYDSTDGTNDAIQVSRIYHIVDTIAPVITIPDDKIFEAIDVLTPLDITQIAEATATDADSNLTFTNNSTGLFPLGDTIIFWTVNDSSQNTSNGIQTITIKDETNPVITAPENIQVEATAILTPVTITDATATDIFSTTVSRNNTDTTFQLGNTIILWGATDDNGNTASIPQTVTIVDTTKPEISVPDDLIIESDTPLNLTTVDFGKATATDIFGITITNNAPTEFLIEETIINWTATDDNGNESTATQRINIVLPPDTISPIITLNGNPTITLLVGIDTFTELGATVTDNDTNYSESVIIGGDMVEDVVGTYIVTYNAPPDAAGNEPEQVIRTVNVERLNPVTPPSSPHNLVATPGDGQVTLSWDAPKNGIVTDYKIKWRLFAGQFAFFDDGISTDTSVTVTGLENDRNYRFMVQAVNDAGQARSKQVHTTPNEHGIEYTKPSAPQNISTIGGDGQIIVSWDAPLDDGGIAVKEYRIRYNDFNSPWKKITIEDGSLRTFTITDLENDQNIRIRIQAITEAANGYYSRDTIASPTAPLP